jgi:hypothetical protein
MPPKKPARSDTELIHNLMAGAESTPIEHPLVEAYSHSPDIHRRLVERLRFSALSSSILPTAPPRAHGGAPAPKEQAMPAKDPELIEPGEIVITIDVHTVHAAYAQLWISPPGSGQWEQRKDVATAPPPPRSERYEVERNTALAWRVYVATTAGAGDFVVSLTITQLNRVIPNGVILLRGKTADTGQAKVEGAVLLR